MEYGPALRELWPLAPDVTYLDHGGYGVTPKEIMAHAAEWRTRIEANPTGFMTREYPKAIRNAAAVLAAFIGTAAEQVVFVGNATDGINAVLRSLDLGPDDEIVIPDVGYRAILKAVGYIGERTGAKVVIPTVPIPLADADAAVAAFTNAIGPRTRLVVVDHIGSATGIVMPVQRIAAAARAVGARVLVDGAHAAGQIPIAVTELGADWYVGNLHKWLFAPRACGFLWAADPVRNPIHPVAISFDYGRGFTAEFDWTGTRDPTAFLSVPATIAFHRRLGGTALMDRNATLARAGAALIADGLRAPLGAPREMFASMATVVLPPRFGATDAEAFALRRKLGEEYKIEALVIGHAGGSLLRVAAQAYNERADYERLLGVLQGL